MLAVSNLIIITKFPAQRSKRCVSNESRVGVPGDCQRADVPVEATTDGSLVLFERSSERRTVDSVRVSIGIGLSVPEIVLPDGFSSDE